MVLWLPSNWILCVKTLRHLWRPIHYCSHVKRSFWGQHTDVLGSYISIPYKIFLSKFTGIIILWTMPWKWFWTYFLIVLSLIYDSVLHLDSSLFISGAHGPILEISFLKNDSRLILSMLSKACEKFGGQAVRLRSPRPWIPDKPARSKNKILI